jgi:hypothetical protein
MAGNARFHNKLHRKDHHTSPTVGYPDSASDPIASPSEPFQGDFVVNGLLSTNTGINFLSADVVGDIICENLTTRNFTYCDFISGVGTETIISDGALTGHGSFSMTMDFRQRVVAKTPIFVATNNLSANNILYASTANFSGLNVTSNTNIGGNLLVQGNLSALGDISYIETNIVNTSSLSVSNVGSTVGLLVDNLNISYPIASFRNGGSIVSEIKNTGLTTIGTISASNNVIGTNITTLQSTSGIWDTAYNSLTSTSGNWNASYNSLTSTSAFWNTVYNINLANSANWNSVYNTTLNTSSTWVNSYNSLTSTSGNWNSAYSALTSTSANWNASYNALTSTSANWDSSYNALTSTSANWNSAYNSLTSTSANWDSSYNALTSTSANWNSVYNTVNSTSGDFLSGKSTLNFVASTGTFNTHVSTNHIHIVKSLYVPVSSVTLTGDITLEEHSPTYLFINPNGTARNVELPAVNSSQTGLTFIIKNTDTNNHTIDIHYNGGLGVTPVVQITNGNYKQVIANGGTNTWLVL